MKKTKRQSTAGHKHDPTKDIIACSIKMLPEDQWIAAAETAVRVNRSNKPSDQQFTRATGEVLPPEHLAVLTAKRWPSTGVSLTVGFIENVDPALRTRILSHMNSWGAYCNVSFTETTVNPQVRISLQGSGYWSYLGTDILHIPANQPTMNLQGFSMGTPESEYHRVVRHETGHTLGFPHEHLRAEIVNRIDPAKAKAYFLANDGWDAATTTAQVLTPIDSSALLATAHADPTSIMCYWLPASIMKDNVAVAGGTDIDAQDQTFAATVYPKPKTVIKDISDHKHLKNELKELKQETKEHKIELKEHKIEIKEHIKEHKIEAKEHKIENKEKIELIEHKVTDKLLDKLRDGPVNPINPGETQSEISGSLAARVRELEATVGVLRSFIESNLRPDVSQGALLNE